jgi:uncharacterized protein YoxC
MTLVSVAALIVALAVIILVAVLIPVIAKLKKTIISVREFIVRTEDAVTPTLGELRQTLANVRVMTDAAAARSNDITTIMTALGETGESIHRLNGILDGAVNVVEKPAMYWTGIKAAAQNIAGNFTRKGGN